MNNSLIKKESMAYYKFGFVRYFVRSLVIF